MFPPIFLTRIRKYIYTDVFLHRYRSYPNMPIFLHRYIGNICDMCLSLLMLLLISTSFCQHRRCSSSRNSLRGITHPSIHPVHILSACGATSSFDGIFVFVSHHERVEEAGSRKPNLFSTSLFYLFKNSIYVWKHLWNWLINYIPDS